jgi:DNA modification methylase
MNGVKADMVFTDPPYNIASHAKNHAASTLREGSYGRLSESEWDKNFEIKNIFPVIEKNIADNSSCYICTSHFLLPDILQWTKNFFDYSNVCIWSKPNPMPSLAKRHWTWAHEFVAYGTKGKHIFNFPEQGHASSVWSFNKVSKCDLHPTMKPISVPEHAIAHSSKPSDSVLDLFLGSGSTLIACEKTGRKCYGMELSPQYIDVILKRYIDFVGSSSKVFLSLDGGETIPYEKVLEMRS